MSAGSQTTYSEGEYIFLIPLRFNSSKQLYNYQIYMKVLIM